MLPPRLELRPLHWRLIGAGTLHLLAAIVIFLVPLTALLKAFAYLIIAIHWWLYFRRDYQCHGRCSFPEWLPQDIKHWHWKKTTIVD